ncbi:FadR/GntR family transcriptional regulator [Mechercharimyces sp. CAU 1602]|uniref:FadR/GntR family transcriptional regulator n=1 Tax=Mechercharimyces sp. CAU 1602 TaxID=2973933 RepID=UPI002162C1A7|nr:GntR family transcriptional regulator [Mechercharimyces sp. CAU 1602]MCS1351617.1 GntR family transcriptional regulator [Mechercharimyces sp. CAU 1602]
MLPAVGSNKFQSLLSQINALITIDQLEPGSRLPSERELAERLGSSRATVREVLRSLELLGIITTRRGEGTFLSEMEGNQFVEILAFYILRDAKSEQELLELWVLLEANAIYLAAKHATENDMYKLDMHVVQMHKVKDNQVHFQKEVRNFHHTLVRSAHHSLLLKIWRLVVEYGNTLPSPFQQEDVDRAIQSRKSLIACVRAKECWTAMARLLQLAQ